MKQEEINNIIENKHFGLKDFNRTLNKYQNYKTDKVNLFFNENQDDIKRYVGGTLFYLVFGELKNRINNFNWLNLFKEQLSKKKINYLMTIINGITFNQNKQFIEMQDNLNKNEIKNFTIILYLRNYEQINNIMKKVLFEYLKDYNKKAVIGSLKNDD